LLEHDLFEKPLHIFPDHLILDYERPRSREFLPGRIAISGHLNDFRVMLTRLCRITCLVG